MYAAGLSAATRARRLDPRLEILVLEKGPVVSYGACGLPYFVEGRVRDASQLIVYTPEYFRKQRNIEVRTGARVVAMSHPRGRSRSKTARGCATTIWCWRPGRAAIRGGLRVPTSRTFSPCTRLPTPSACAAS